MTATTFAAAPAAEPIIPTSYTIRVTITRCNTCNYVSRQSEFMSLTLIKPRMGAGQPAKHWTECKRPEYDLPVDRVFVNRMTPYCAECPEIDLSLLPLPPAAQGLTVLPDVTLKGQPAKKTAAPRAAKPSIEDLA
jgi:hypothetical protein